MLNEYLLGKVKGVEIILSLGQKGNISGILEDIVDEWLVLEIAPNEYKMLRMDEIVNISFKKEEEEPSAKKTVTTSKKKKNSNE